MNKRFKNLELEEEKEEKKVTKLDYKKSISIDKDKLDLEWLVCGNEYMDWVEHQADCNDIVDDKENKLKLLEAQLDKKIRSSEDNDTKKKLTEVGIKNEIIINQEFQDLKEEIRVAKFNLNIAKGVLDSLDRKKKALEKLVDLWIMGYNSEPKQSSNVKTKILDGVSNRVRSDLNKNKGK
jgi:hypothetical protein